MATSPQQPVTSHPRSGGEPLSESLVTLAGTPDDASDIPGQLAKIIQLIANLVTPVDYASVTAHRDDAYTTVATSGDLALAVDLAQYADRVGPCLDAIETGTPMSAPDIATTMAWPGFRDEALRLGLRASLSVPLFAGRGVPIAALNLYSHDPDTMAPLIAEVWAVYDPQRADGAQADGKGCDGKGCDGKAGDGAQAERLLDPGSAQLVSGLAEAFGVRDTIQQAIGVIMARRRYSADDAYLVLRMRAAETGTSLTAIATGILDDATR